jgi:hypothetical protein
VSISGNFDQFFRDVDTADKKRVTAGVSVVKAEGYRLWKAMRADVKAGAPGGRPLTPLREISQWARKKKPLSGLWRAIRYKRTGSGSTLRMEIGAVDSRAQRRASADEESIFGGAIREWAGKGLSASWVSIFARQQSGVTTAVTPQLRRMLIQIGARRKKRKNDTARFFFLRKGTTTFSTPARDIVDTFWASQRGGLSGRLTAAYEEKLRGGIR